MGYRFCCHSRSTWVSVHCLHCMMAQMINFVVFYKKRKKREGERWGKERGWEGGVRKRERKENREEKGKFKGKIINGLKWENLNYVVSGLLEGSENGVLIWLPEVAKHSAHESSRVKYPVEWKCSFSWKMWNGLQNCKITSSCLDARFWKLWKKQNPEH